MTGLSDSNVQRLSDLIARFPPQDRVLSTILRRQALRYGDRTLLVSGSTRWSYTETASIAATSAKMLSEAGVIAGDRVAICCSNRPEFLQLYLGSAWIGAIAVPVNTAWRGRQLAHVFRNAEPSLLAIEDSLVPALDSIDRGLLPERIWSIGAGAWRPVPGIEPLLLPGPGAGLAPAAVRAGETVAILYTSGTTGPSKGVCCPQAQMFWWGVYSARALGIREGDVLLTTLPLFHTNALNAFYQALLNGATYVLEPKFSASRFWLPVRQHRATVIYLLGAMPAMLLAQPETAQDRDHAVRIALGGGVPGHLPARFRARFGVPLLEGYASTESNFVVAGPVPSDRPGSMGYLAEGIEARVVDADDNPLPDGQAGELLLRSDAPFCFATGYFRMPEQTVACWRNLWLHTGDRVVREADGCFRFVDRMKDMIRRRGENVSAWEVEQVLLLHPAIAACAAYPLPSELGEEEVAVAIVLKPASVLFPEDVIRHCQGQLAYFAIPRFIRFVGHLPLTENGKVRKASLREAGMTGEIWDRETAGRN